MLHADAAPAAPRQLISRSTLPNSRAVVGGLLIAIASLGTFWASQRAAQQPGTRYVTVDRAVPPGTPLTADDLTVASMTVPVDVGSRYFTSVEAVVGATPLVALAAGDPVSRSTVLLGGVAAPAYEVSIPIPAARAVDGTLRAGDRVDVVATLGSGEASWTQAVARAVPVIAVDRGAKRVGGDALVVTLAAPSEQDMLAIHHAVEGGHVSVVRSTYAPGRSGENPALGPVAVYQPEAPADGGPS